MNHWNYYIGEGIKDGCAMLAVSILCAVFRSALPLLLLFILLLPISFKVQDITKKVCEDFIHDEEGKKDG